MKKYFYFLPVSVYLYLLWLVNEIKPENNGSSMDIVPYLLVTLFAAITYILGLIQLVNPRKCSAKEAVIISLIVKLPQLVPLCLLLGSGMLLMVFPMGFVLSILIWCFVGFIYCATSVTEAITCVKMWRAQRLSLVGTVISAILSFIPVTDVIVLVVLCVKALRFSNRDLSSHSLS